MMLKIVLVGALFATAASVHADDEHLATLQVGAETYTNVTVTSVSATEIFFKHSRGIGNANGSPCPNLSRNRSHKARRYRRQSAHPSKLNHSSINLRRFYKSRNG